MSHNLTVAYDLINPGQNYEAVHRAIKSLGQWAQLQYSLFYVHSPLDARTAYNRVIAVMDSNDRLAVFETSGGVISAPQPVVDAINGVWYDQAA